MGEGEAGKTSLAKKIEDENYQLNKDEESTHGIEVIQGKEAIFGDPRLLYPLKQLRGEKKGERGLSATNLRSEEPVLTISWVQLWWLRSRVV